MRARSRPDPGDDSRRNHARMDPEMERECGRIEADLTAGPFSPEEYERLLFVRKSSAYPVPAEWDQWKRLVCRFYRLFPNTAKRAMWHEAGHIVVAHCLGWTVHRIQRDREGTPGAVIHMPDGWGDLDHATVSVAGWLAEAMMAYPELTDPTDEVAQHARQFRTPEGEKMPAPERIKYVEIAERRAEEILEAHWDTVERVAALAMAGLPVERDALLAAMADRPEPTTAADPSEDDPIAVVNPDG